MENRMGKTRFTHPVPSSVPARVARLGLSGRRDYTDRNLIEKWFRTVKKRIDRFYHSWVGSRRSGRQWIE